MRKNIQISIRCWLVLCFLVITSDALPITAAEHASHHPGANTTAATGSDVAGSATKAFIADPKAPGMGKMMEGCCGGKNQGKEFYPSLMDLPVLTDEQKAILQVRAHERMKAGAALMNRGLQDLILATQADDYLEMESASALVKEGLAQFGSGVSTHRAIARGDSPQQIGLAWFKTNLSLENHEVQESERAGIFGVSFFHLFLMVFLIAFAVIMIVMYFMKMRRASELLNKIGNPAPAAPTPVAPAPAAPAPAAPAPAAPAPAAPAPAAPAPAAPTPAAPAPVAPAPVAPAPAAPTPAAPAPVAPAPVAPTPAAPAPAAPAPAAPAPVAPAPAASAPAPSVPVASAPAAPAPAPSVPVASAPAAPKLDPPGPATPAPDTKSSIAKTPADEASKHWKGKLKVASIYIETPLVKTFRFANPTGEDLPFTYEAGQFLTLGVTVDGKPVKRSYSIGSHPCQHDAIELTIKREDHGLVSRYMHDVVREGDLLNVDTAYGNLIFSDLGDRPIVLIGGGVGITPLMAVIRCMISCGMKNSIHLFYGCKSLSDFVFRDELEYLQKRNPNLKLTIGVHTLVGSFPGAYQGRINQEHIEKDVPDIAHSRVHLCGPPPLMLAMQKILEDLHVPKDQIKTEAFGPSAAPAASAPAASAPAASAPAASAPAASAPAASAPAASAPAASAPAASAPAAQAGTTVVFKKSGQTLSIAPDQTVLELSEQYGINIPFVCRVGTCGACKVPLLSGQVDMEVQVALTDEDKQKGIILACQAKAKSNLEIQDP